MRLPPSQAGGRLLSGMLLMGGGGAFCSVAIGVPCSLITGPANPLETVPQVEGGLPANGVIVQQVTRLRIKKKPPNARMATATQKIIPIVEGRFSLMFLSEFNLLFIEVLYTPYQGRGVPILPGPNVEVKR